MICRSEGNDIIGSTGRWSLLLSNVYDKFTDIQISIIYIIKGKL